MYYMYEICYLYAKLSNIIWKDKKNNILIHLSECPLWDGIGIYGINVVLHNDCISIPLFRGPHYAHSYGIVLRGALQVGCS